MNGEQLACSNNVSIHAPAGGATQRTYYDVQLEQVSIHAPAGGATKVQFHPT